MDVDAHIRSARTVMRAHGYYLQGVAPAGFGTLFDLYGAGDARLATSAWSLHVNTPTPAEVDTALRPFVRNGLLRPAALRSTGDPCPPPVEDCPDCRAAERSRH